MDKVELSNELQQRLVTVLDYLGDTAKHGADLAAKELPEVAREIVLLGMIFGWSGVVVGLLFFVLGLAGVVWGLKKDSEGTCVVGVVLFVLSFPVFFTNFDDAVTATFAPRVYLIEWVADKVK